MLAGERGHGRLIPAHAGKTGSHHRFDQMCRAHPRSRGENFDRTNCISVSSGSSPLTRGKRRLDQVDQPCGRLIPAHAGKTISEHANSDPAQAHPRSRGENTQAFEAAPEAEWLIPAHAGKTGVDQGPGGP